MLFLICMVCLFKHYHFTVMTMGFVSVLVHLQNLALWLLLLTFPVMAGKRITQLWVLLLTPGWIFFFFFSLFRGSEIFRSNSLFRDPFPSSLQYFSYSFPFWTSDHIYHQLSSLSLFNMVVKAMVSSYVASGRILNFYVS